jgi:hypothetical protein
MGAILSEDKRYRYSLWRVRPRLAVNQGGGRESIPWPCKTATFIMFNPSTADAEVNDPTIRRCMRFAWDWGYEILTVVNLFAFRATSPKKLAAQANPVGADNNDHIDRAAINSDCLVAAWGNNGIYLKRDEEILKFLRPFDIYALGVTKKGQPKHPLYVAASTKPFLWKAKRK